MTSNEKNSTLDKIEELKDKLKDEKDQNQYTDFEKAVKNYMEMLKKKKKKI